MFSGKRPVAAATEIKGMVEIVSLQRPSTTSRQVVTAGPDFAAAHITDNLTCQYLSFPSLSSTVVCQPKMPCDWACLQVSGDSVCFMWNSVVLHARLSTIETSAWPCV